jgi:hypothetical protein
MTRATCSTTCSTIGEKRAVHVPRSVGVRCVSRGDGRGGHAFALDQKVRDARADHDPEQREPERHVERPHVPAAQKQDAAVVRAKSALHVHVHVVQHVVGVRAVSPRHVYLQHTHTHGAGQCSAMSEKSAGTVCEPGACLYE